MNRVTRVALIAGVAVVTAAGAAAAQPWMGRGGQNADADGDGRISQAEFVAARTAAFARMDADGDGRVTAEEAQAARAAARAEMLSRRFARLDVDGDGMISRAEFEAGHQGGQCGFHRRGPGREASGEGFTREQVEARAAAMFARMDADGDGYVTSDDRRARMEARRGHHRRGPAAPTE